MKNIKYKTYLKDVFKRILYLLKFNIKNKHVFLFLFTLLLIGCSCKKEKYDVDNFYGHVIFYTNAQFILNCGDFDVDIYMDSIKVGTIEKSFLPVDSVPSCETEDTTTTFILEKETGIYNYNAYCSCSNYGKWTGIFEIIKDSCTIVFLNIYNAQTLNK